MKNDVTQTAKAFKALGYEKRLKILNHVINNSGKTVSEISNDLRLPFATVSRNLIILSDARLVKGICKNNMVTYRVEVGISKQNLLLLSMVKHAFEIDRKSTDDGKPMFSGLLMGNYAALKDYINL